MGPRLLGTAGIVLVACMAALGRIPSPDEHIPLFLTVFAVAFAAYCVAVVAALRSRGATRGALAFMVVIAVLMRVALIASPPALSTDIYRYLWEGRVVADGLNPFEHAPDDDAVAHLRDGNYDGINHKDLATIYPPLAQGVFALGAALHPSLTMQKVLFSIFDVATVFVLIALLSLRRLNAMRAAVYAWSPLVVVETAHSGHLDAAGIFMLMLGILLVLNGRRFAGFAALGGAFLAKFASAILVPFFALRRDYRAWLALMAMVVVAGYLPFAGAGSKLFSSLIVYGAEWHFNAAVYGAVRLLWDEPVVVRRILMVCVVAYAVLQAVRRDDLVRYAYLTIGCALLLTPTLYPWYLAWIVPFLCMFPNRAWILLTGLSFASYAVWMGFHDGGEWVLPAWVYAVEYVPFFGLLIVDALRNRGTGQGEAKA